MRLLSGSGRYSDLYQADRDGRFWVYKCLKPEYRGNPVYERLLRKEFEIGYSLSHVNICEVYSFTDMPGIGNCIEMEWVDGMSLEQLLRTGRLDGQDAVRIVSQLCDALSYMHSKQIMHRDLKPSNILVTHNGRNVKLIDFGLSDSDSYSVLKAPAGTEFHTAPEVLAGDKPDCRSDIYSLGTVICKMAAKLDDKVLAKRLRKVAVQCCSMDRERRPSSCEAIKKAVSKTSHRPTGAVLAYSMVVLLVVISLLAIKSGKDEEAPIIQHVRDTIVTIVQQPMALPQEAEPDAKPKAADKADAPKKSAKKHAADSAKIEEIFREASDLFDE